MAIEDDLFTSHCLGGDIENIIEHLKKYRTDIKLIEIGFSIAVQSHYIEAIKYLISYTKYYNKRFNSNIYSSSLLLIMNDVFRNSIYVINIIQYLLTQCKYEQQSGFYKYLCGRHYFNHVKSNLNIICIHKYIIQYNKYYKLCNHSASTYIINNNIICEICCESIYTNIYYTITLYVSRLIKI